MGSGQRLLFTSVVLLSVLSEIATITLLYGLAAATNLPEGFVFVVLAALGAAALTVFLRLWALSLSVGFRSSSVLLFAVGHGVALLVAFSYQLISLGTPPLFLILPTLMLAVLPMLEFQSVKR